MTDNENIRQQFVNYMEQFKELESKIKMLCNQLHEVYGIWASRGSEYHFVCYFFTKEQAQKEVDRCGCKSEDADNGTAWYYSVKKVTDLTNIDMFKLDKVPSHFPYVSWYKSNYDAYYN